MSLSQLAVLNGLMRPPRTRLMLDDHLADTAYVIHKGLVKVVVDQSDGSELILAILGPGDVMGELTIGDCLGGARSIVSLDETSLFWLDRSAFEQCLQTMPTLSANLSNILARRVRTANERIEALAGLDVRSRVVRHLLLLAREYGEAIDCGGGDAVRIPLRLTQGDLGRLVGASRVRINHALSELRRREVVMDRGDHCLVITDMAALQKLR
jgi:CRP/FNR family transcriptional regulator, cyclic AMP receptor protein